MADSFKLVQDDAERRGISQGPHGWIQWKGTDVCMDVRCSCGAQTHLDADFAYHVKCGACGKFWAVSSYVALVPIDGEPDGCWRESIDYDAEERGDGG